MPTNRTYERAAEIAASTSMRNAARVLGISTTTVRRAMKKHGVPFRRQGNLTVAEIAQMKMAGWRV